MQTHGIVCVCKSHAGREQLILRINCGSQVENAIAPYQHSRQDAPLTNPARLLLCWRSFFLYFIQPVHGMG
jgi:hypothetical protein